MFTFLPSVKKPFILLIVHCWATIHGGVYIYGGFLYIYIFNLLKMYMHKFARRLTMNKINTCKVFEKTCEQLNIFL